MQPLKWKHVYLPVYTFTFVFVWPTHTQRYTHKHRLTQCSTLWLCHANLTIGVKCKHAACWFESPAETASELWTAEETLIWMETSCLCVLVQLLAMCSQKQAQCARGTEWQNVWTWGADMSVISVTGEEKEQSRSFLIPLSIKRKLTKQNAQSHSYISTHSTHFPHSRSLLVPSERLHCSNCKGSKPHDWPCVVVIVT